jgi:nitroreductase
MTLLPTVPDHRRAITSAPIEELLAVRWSPRSFDADAAVDDEQIASLLEAARWASSASNVQARRFIVARRGTATFDRIVELLMGFNQVWARKAALLVVGVAVTAPEDAEARAGAHRWAEYDLGQSMANLATQAHALGLHVHPMGGIDVEGLQAAFDLPARYLPVTVVAVGQAAGPESLPEALAAREHAERTRLPLDELVLVND